MNSIRTLVTVSLIGGLVGFVGCTERTDSTGSTDGGTTPTEASAPTGWLLASAPADPVDVGEAKKTAKAGDRIALRGRIGGTKTPFGDGAALFLVMDPAVPSCADLHADKCPTPWDYCCEPQDSKIANNATVQIVGEDGAVMEFDPKAAGLKELDEVIVTGTVGDRPNENVLIIEADGVFVVKG